MHLSHTSLSFCFPARTGRGQDREGAEAHDAHGAAEEHQEGARSREGRQERPGPKVRGGIAPKMIQGCE